jgi:hypothetical protein
LLKGGFVYRDFHYQKGDIYYSRVIALDEDTSGYLNNDKYFYIFFKYNFFYSLKRKIVYVFYNSYFFKRVYAVYIKELEDYMALSYEGYEG